MNWRRASRLSVITLAILVVVIVWLVQRHTTSPAHNTTTSPMATPATSTPPISLQGTKLGNKVAPTFQLTDQNGQPVSLEQLKGKPVVLTFLNTDCTGSCIQVVNTINTSLQQLNSTAHTVTVLTVSTDASKDTTATALKFSETHHLQNAWHYLTGQQAKLNAICSSYGIQPATQAASNAVYIIDKQGNERVTMNHNFTSEQLTTNLQQLLNQ